MLKTFDQFLHEDVQKLLKEPSTLAGKEARQLGLQYYGFGKYGKNGVATHVVVAQHLKPISRNPEVKDPKLKGHEDTVAHSKGLKNNPKLTKMKKSSPDFYKKNVTKASERLKIAASKMKDTEAVYKTLDQAEPEFEKFINEKEKESEDLHKKMVGFYDWRGLSDEEKQVLLHFSEEGYREIKDIFAAGKKPHHKSHVAKYLNILGKIMAKTDAPTNLYTYAGFASDDVLEAGGEYVIPEIRSTTTNIRIALAYLRDDDTKQLIQFKVKKHQQGFYMDGNNSEATNQGEREFLLPQDTKIKITTEPRLVHVTDANKITFYEAVIVDASEADDYSDPNDDPNVVKS